jgi:hypothetical protein
MKEFSNISAIEPEVRATWISKVFLSFDIDWAHDDILADSINIVRDAGVASTWFVTHTTPLLQQLRNLNDAELGIHPNFNLLLDGKCLNSGNSAEKVIKNILSLVPVAARCGCVPGLCLGPLNFTCIETGLVLTVKRNSIFH